MFLACARTGLRSSGCCEAAFSLSFSPSSPLFDSSLLYTSSDIQSYVCCSVREDADDPYKEWYLGGKSCKYVQSVFWQLEIAFGWGERERERERERDYVKEKWQRKVKVYMHKHKYMLCTNVLRTHTHIYIYIYRHRARTLPRRRRTCSAVRPFIPLATPGVLLLVIPNFGSLTGLLTISCARIMDFLAFALREARFNTSGAGPRWGGGAVWVRAAKRSSGTRASKRRVDALARDRCCVKIWLRLAARGSAREDLL